MGAEVQGCEDSKFKRRRREGEVESASMSIRLFCSECFGHKRAEVPECTDPACWLYPWRTGTPTARKRRLSPAAVAKRRASLEAARAKQARKST